MAYAEYKWAFNESWKYQIFNSFENTDDVHPPNASPPPLQGQDQGKTLPPY